MRSIGISILIVGICVALISLAFAYFFHVQPNQQEKEYAVQFKSQLEAEIAKRGAAQARLDDARAKVMELSDSWQAIVAEKTPPIGIGNGGIDLSVNPYQLAVDSPKFRDSLQRKVNAQLKVGGVNVVNGPLIPNPTQDAGSLLASFYNYPAANFPVCVFNLGTVTVRGSYDQISRNIRSWSNVKGYMAVADNPVIVGTSPRLTATYALTIVAYVRGDQLPATMPGAAPAGAPGAPAGIPAAPVGQPAGLDEDDR
jgi:hypothetical protein